VVTYISYKSLAKKLGVSKQTISRWIRLNQNDFPSPVKIGTRSAFVVEEIAAWQESRERGIQPKPCS